MGEIMGAAFSHTIEKGLEWSRVPDAKPWDVFVPPENMGEIFEAVEHGRSIVFVIGRVGMGKDHLKLHLLGSKRADDLGTVWTYDSDTVWTYQVFDEKKIVKEHTANIRKDIVHRKIRINKRVIQLEGGDDADQSIYLFRRNLPTRYAEIVEVQYLEVFLDKVTIFHLPDTVSSRSEAKKQMKTITTLFERLKSAENIYYEKVGEAPWYKLLVFMLEEHAGPKLEHIRDMQIINKADIVVLKPYSADLLMEMYIKNVVGPALSEIPLAEDEKYSPLPFTEAGLRHLAQHSSGNPRRFKSQIYDNLIKLRRMKRDDRHLLGIEDIEITEEEDRERIELELLYAGLIRANARVTKYYPRVKRIIQENPDIAFKTQKQILECATANYPPNFLNTRKISEVLKLIKEQNDVNAGTRKYPSLIYVDEKGVFRL